MPDLPAQDALDEALLVVNDLKGDLADLVKAIVQACDDSQVTSQECMRMGMKGMAFADTLIAVLQDGTPATREAIRYVLAEGEFVLPQ